MLRYLLDTDHLTLFQHGHPLVVQRLRLQAVATVGTSVATIEEALRGRLARLAGARDGKTRIGQYRLLAETLQLFAQFPVASYDQPAEDEFQKLGAVRIGTRDRKIAATALTNRLIVVTSNRRDFGRVPALVIEDWSV